MKYYNFILLSFLIFFSNCEDKSSNTEEIEKPSDAKPQETPTNELNNTNNDNNFKAKEENVVGEKNNQFNELKKNMVLEDTKYKK